MPRKLTDKQRAELNKGRDTSVTEYIPVYADVERSKAFFNKILLGIVVVVGSGALWLAN